MKIIDFINCNNDNIISKESKMIANVLLSGSPYQIYNYKQISDEVYNKYGCYIRFNYLDKTAFKKNNVAPHTVGQYAGEISNLCSKMSLPLISVMIFNGQLPGEGFYTFPLCKELLAKGLTEKEISIEIRNQVAECFETNSWERLIDYLNGKSTTISNFEESKAIIDKQKTNSLKEQFYEFLIQEGFSDRTPSGNPSTTYDYLKRIDFVCENESFNWEFLAQNIDTILKNYGVTGIKAELGAKSHNAVFSALKQYKLFVGQSKKEKILEKSAEIIQEIESIEDKETEKQALIKIRIGHSKLKEIVLRNKTKCDICGLNHPKLLIASHIKPWSKSDDKEKLDYHNILLLCPIHDALFDKGLISFNDIGQILISKELNVQNRIIANIDNSSCINVTSEKQKEYLQWHRENVFIK